MIFKDSELAHKLLDGLTGIEIGGSAHNPFHLDTINVDRPGSREKWGSEQTRICGDILKVDVEAYGDDLPFEDKSFDFVISSHVFEHFVNPLKVLVEWERVARRYILMIVPHATRINEGAPMATVAGLGYVFDQGISNDLDTHHYGYTPDNMAEILNQWGYRFTIHDPDDKVGNGFTVVIDLNNA